MIVTEFWMKAHAILPGDDINSLTACCANASPRIRGQSCPRLRSFKLSNESGRSRN